MGTEALEGKNIVLIGGGTGSSVFLRTLKKYTHNITSIVTVADDGGSSGSIRDSFDMVAPGDIRSCIVALADDESIMASLMDMRFSEKSFHKHSFGNIMLAAMNKLTGNFPLAVEKVSEVLAIKGRVLPVTTANVALKAYVSDGSVVMGESLIPIHCEMTGARIIKVELSPSNAEIYAGCQEAIANADIIVICPGSLYTSIIPNFLVQGMCDAISESSAMKYWIMNIMTQPGETDGYSMSDHVKAFEKHCGKLAEHIIYSSSSIHESALERYRLDHAAPVRAKIEASMQNSYEWHGIDTATVTNEGLIRHDSDIVWNFIASHAQMDKRYIV
ncbi:MAG: YvcK family protein [Eubacteriaceae bacterium]|nr:YvcK family protein [Eubacteriaceae bacterium]